MPSYLACVPVDDDGDVCGTPCQLQEDCKTYGKPGILRCYPDHPDIAALNISGDGVGVCDCSAVLKEKGEYCSEMTGGTIFQSVLGLIWFMLAVACFIQCCMMLVKLKSELTPKGILNPAMIALISLTLSYFCMAIWFSGNWAHGFRVDKTGIYAMNITSPFTPLTGSFTIVSTLLIGLLWIDMSSKKLKKTGSNRNKQIVGGTAVLFFVIVMPVYFAIDQSLAAAFSILFVIGLTPSLFIGGRRIAASLVAGGSAVTSPSVTSVQRASVGMCVGYMLYVLGAMVYVVTFSKDHPHADEVVTPEPFAAMVLIPLGLSITLNSCRVYVRFGMRKKLGIDDSKFGSGTSTAVTTTGLTTGTTSNTTESA